MRNRQTIQPDRKLQWLSAIGEPPPRREIVQGLIAEGEIAFITGHPKSGKSTLAVSMAAAVSTGSDFLGLPILKQGTTIYLAAERENSVRRRLFVAKSDPTQIAVGSWAPSLADGATEMIREIERLDAKPVVLVLDKLARLMPGLDENLAKDASSVIGGLQRILDTFPWLAIIVVHHLPKEGNSPRGSSALLAGVDIDLRVGKEHQRPVLKISSANSIPEGGTIPFELQTRLYDQIEDVVAVERRQLAQGQFGTANWNHLPPTWKARDRRAYELLTREGVSNLTLLDALRSEGFLDGVDRSNHRKTVDRICKRIDAFRSGSQ